ncbi:MAG: hypothetical protein R2786_04670 [Flavobacteriaceae bacterium]
MKTAFSIPAFLFLCVASWAQVGINTIAPKGILDVESSVLGIIPPRVALTKTIISSPVINPNLTPSSTPLQDGTLVYNTNTINDVSPGYYTWIKDRWKRLSSEPSFFVFKTVDIPNALVDDAEFLLDELEDNYTANVIRITHSNPISGSATLGGISDGIHGRVLYIYNSGTTDIKLLANNNSASIGSNRFSLQGDVIVKSGSAALLIYDEFYAGGLLPVGGRWIPIITGN